MGLTCPVDDDVSLARHDFARLSGTVGSPSAEGLPEPLRPHMSLRPAGHQKDTGAGFTTTPCRSRAHKPADVDLLVFGSGAARSIGLPAVQAGRFQRDETGEMHSHAHLIAVTDTLVKLVVDNNIEKRTVNRQPSTVVINETQLPEFVHEEADP